jgi:hypothetical protein
MLIRISHPNIWCGNSVTITDGKRTTQYTEFEVKSIDDAKVLIRDINMELLQNGNSDIITEYYMGDCKFFTSVC